MKNMSEKYCADSMNGTEKCCRHSYCEIQRRKKQTGCIDLPPKGLPWASGRLKYLPGQRDLYCDLYVKNMVEHGLMKTLCCPNSKSVKSQCPKQKCVKKCNVASNGAKASRNKCRKRGSRSSGRSSFASEHSSRKEEVKAECDQSQKGPDSYNAEEVMIYDSETQRLRKGYILRPNAPTPDTPKDKNAAADCTEKDAAADCTEQDAAADCTEQDAAADCTEQENMPSDVDIECEQENEKTEDVNDIICLFIPRSCLEQYENPERHLSKQDISTEDENMSEEEKEKGEEEVEEEDEVGEEEEKEEE